MVDFLELVAAWAEEKGWWFYVCENPALFNCDQKYINVSIGGRPPFDSMNYVTIWEDGAIARTAMEHLKLKPADPNYFRDLEIYLEGTR